MKVISLFDYTGNMLRPWHDAGFECHLYDIQHPEGVTRREDGMVCHGFDLSSPPAVEENIAFVSAFPPCTDVSVSGSRWFKGKGLRALQESIGYFATAAEFCEASDAIYFIENPKTTISTYWRSPDYKFHPAHYSNYVDGGDFYTKETWLWTGGGLVMPPRSMKSDLFDEPDRNYIHHQPPGPERANIRSATPKGFAQAVFEHNSGAVEGRELLVEMNG